MMFALTPDAMVEQVTVLDATDPSHGTLMRTVFGAATITGAVGLVSMQAASPTAATVIRTASWYRGVGAFIEILVGVRSGDCETSGGVTQYGEPWSLAA